uniref:Uncharacterized protein n=1 Tax=Parascaris equorum TaxID=6256 RepID=A0A914R8R3_PAREQ
LKNICQLFEETCNKLKLRKTYKQPLLLPTQQYREFLVLIMQKGHEHVDCRNFTFISSSLSTTREGLIRVSLSLLISKFPLGILPRVEHHAAKRRDDIKF